MHFLFALVQQAAAMCSFLSYYKSVTLVKTRGKIGKAISDFDP